MIPEQKHHESCFRPKYVVAGIAVVLACLSLGFDALNLKEFSDIPSGTEIAQPNSKSSFDLNSGVATTSNNNTNTPNGNGNGNSKSIANAIYADTDANFHDNIKTNHTRNSTNSIPAKLTTSTSTATATTEDPQEDPRAPERVIDPPRPDPVPDTGQPVLTVLVMLSGEFGNNLFKIIRGWGTARLLEQEFGIRSRMVFVEQSDHRGWVISKARATTKLIQRCFVSPSWLKTLDFRIGNELLNGPQHENYFRELGVDENYSPENASLSWNINHGTIDDVRKTLKGIADYLADNPSLVEEANHNSYYNASITRTRINQDLNHAIEIETERVPRLMLRVDSMNVYPIIDEFYDAFRETFVFDDAGCCGPETLEHPPGPDESVLHLRNFATEMKQSRRQNLGFEEISSHRLAHHVLGHLKEGDELAITGRNLAKDSERNNTESYRLVQALRGRNLTLRFAPGNDPMADFCFLTKAQKELVGTSMSTYFKLAAFMGVGRNHNHNYNRTSSTSASASASDGPAPSIQIARMYQYVTPAADHKVWSLKLFRTTVGDNWTHPELRAKVRFEEYFPDFVDM